LEHKRITFAAVSERVVWEEVIRYLTIAFIWRTVVVFLVVVVFAVVTGVAATPEKRGIVLIRRLHL